ncbi:MAG: hypothetical protein M1828_002345 [Chrysothrix sp. TS-e1954]|nr:MAG: hypothetical protein M1828_002345 [Chrysothrix sp. TS-e1954]
MRISPDKSQSTLGFAFTALVSLSTAQHLVEQLSFGHRTPLSPGGLTIPGWQSASENHTPQILSDRIVLTPPSPGHARGSLWTEQASQYSSWSGEISFRASGPERGSGNLQIWYTRTPQPASSLSSVYTVGEFDGLVLVVDQYGGRGGMIRGFLNDGTMNFKNHHSVDGLAFGNCEYSYRNRGEYTRMQIKVDEGVGLEVEVDGRKCFGSEHIQLPAGYHFGISAASAETPDSFEVSKFTMSSASIATPEPGRAAPFGGAMQRPFTSTPEESSPSRGSSITETQFADLMSRLSSLQSQTDRILREFANLESRLGDRHSDVKASLPGNIASGEQIQNLDQKLDGLSQTVRRIQSDVEGRDYRESLTGLEKALKDTQANLMSGLPASVGQSKSTYLLQASLPLWEGSSG